MSDILLTAYPGSILGPIAKLLGMLMDWIYSGISNITGGRVESVVLSIVIITIIISVPEGLFGTNAMVQVTFRIARLPIAACKPLLDYFVICGTECFRGEACRRDGFSREIKLETKSGFIRRRNRLFCMNGCCRNMQNQVLKFWIRMSGVRVV